MHAFFYGYFGIASQMLLNCANKLNKQIDI